ncbi:hypothetical protein CXG81DRAFT_29580 [Caulochytrium protostelioides]|uniref:Tctex-1 n=1 Tax=Caulochytrium protostelioides TaxID=1555241 RepID=A0A4P9X9Z6_9FUNG|nr:Tctex-1 [Caulochytrium protostelioides]RKP02184.1 hypothetical protein CXG81DRAFT_29580 [Caulochytrium protostelioides]|eukprot:RKP02184.1 hypothetical protein CXG81DRAFT_29580 [Caulochytrium protostelioides]
MDGLRDESEEKAFVVDEVTSLLKEVVDSTIQNATYSHNKVGPWSTNIVEQSLKKLAGLNKPFKYIVTTTIMQKTGAGLHVASTCYWDATTDGSATYKFDAKTMYVIINVYGLAI